MDFHFISEELIIPSSPSIHQLEPFKLCLLDQVFHTTYFPAIFFFSTTNTNVESHEISAKLKKSLSQTLSAFYPLCGRVKDNFFVGNYEKGVPFIETRVRNSLLDFLKQPQLDLLNQFLPCQPMAYHSDPEATPQLAVQLNLFDCGGIALGLCLSHKTTDAATMISFLNSWAANAQGSCKVEEIAGLFEASLRFPPQDPSLLKTVLSVTESVLFNGGTNVTTKRFVFDAEAIATLRAKAKSERVPNPSRVETLSSFIWKSCTEASRSLSATPRPSLSSQAVNIRHRTKPCFPISSIGNLWWRTYAACELTDTKIGLDNLVTLTRESVSKINDGFLKNFQGDKGLQNLCIEADKIMQRGSRNPEMFHFSSWLHFGLNDLDFGWGKPIWVAVAGQVGRPLGCSNITFFKETGSNNEIEAWMNLDANIMSVMERDPEFLKFATPNPSILIPS